MNARLGLPGCEGERIEERECEDLPPCDLLGQWSQERLKNTKILKNNIDVIALNNNLIIFENLSKVGFLFPRM